MTDSDLYHVLKQQIQQYLPSVDVSGAPWKAFLASVNETYQKFDVDQRTLEQSLTLSAEELLQANEEMNAVFAAIPDQLFHLDSSGRVINYKLGQSSHHYLKSEKLINQHLNDVLDIEVVDKFQVSIKQVLEQLSIKHFEFIIYHDKKLYYYEVRMMPVKSREVIALIRDVTERKLAEEQIAFLAYHDSLTALPNNRLFKDRLEHAISQAERSNKILAIMFLDLDRFKLINDTMGHSAGDELLKITSQRLIEAVRKTDSVAINANGNSSSIARFGGDEFTILLDDVENIQAIIRIAERIVENVSQPMMLERQEVHISTSIGIAIYPDDGKQADEILKHADSAMYHAKAQGRNNFQFFADSMNQSSVELLALENNLHKAIDNNELCLYYQPQVSVVTGQVVGMEALIRWQHPERGFVSPGVFIPVAEETGLIMQIGEWVFREACSQGVEWLRSGYQLEKISVNLSARQLKDEGLPVLIALILEETGMPADKLCIELTETALILDPEIALARLKKIKELGIALSLDDFGTGYSSLSYLKRFPIDTLKIDQAFIRDVKVDHEDAALVKAIISMAHGLGMDVIAEGVEVQEQLEFLGANACDTIQGYLFSRPLPAKEMEDLLIKR
ncbi:MAG: response regulator receiver protein [endosymbiont of Galathealinum brachiosum]|uniref:cyclic-guanylate-specific phosphodiesterase n=1 Tax=endosymbiont of Galathealinum brachiosum TaxID=2200906 RepID=A0A370DAT8_9GAMM|nr:MAG: response regulator receiver protein [endosymbiont of Galathealinum brachiosum]